MTLLKSPAAIPADVLTPVPKTGYPKADEIRTLVSFLTPTAQDCYAYILSEAESLLSFVGPKTADEPSLADGFDRADEAAAALREVQAVLPEFKERIDRHKQRPVWDYDVCTMGREVYREINQDENSVGLEKLNELILLLQNASVSYCSNLDRDSGEPRPEKVMDRMRSLCDTEDELIERFDGFRKVLAYCNHARHCRTLSDRSFDTAIETINMPKRLTEAREITTQYRKLPRKAKLLFARVHNGMHALVQKSLNEKPIGEPNTVITAFRFEDPDEIPSLRMLQVGQSGQCQIAFDVLRRDAMQFDPMIPFLDLEDALDPLLSVFRKSFGIHPLKDVLCVQYSFLCDLMKLNPRELPNRLRALGRLEEAQTAAMCARLLSFRESASWLTVRSEGLPVPNYATEPLWEELSAKLSETDLHRFGSLLTHVLSLYDVMRQYPEAEDQFIRLAKFMSMRQYEVFQLTVAPIRGIGVRYKNTPPPSQKILEALNPDKKMSDAEYNRIMSRFVLRMRLAFHDLAGLNFRVLQQSLESAGRVAALFAHFPSPLIASMAKFMGAPATFLGSIQYLFGIMTRIGQPFANDAEVMAARVALASEPLSIERRGRLAGLLAGWSDDDEPDEAE